MLRSIFGPAFDASTDTATFCAFCAPAAGALSVRPSRTKQTREVRMRSESFRPDPLTAGHEENQMNELRGSDVTTAARRSGESIRWHRLDVGKLAPSRAAYSSAV